MVFDGGPLASACAFSRTTRCVQQSWPVTSKAGRGSCTKLKTCCDAAVLAFHARNPIAETMQNRLSVVRLRPSYRKIQENAISMTAAAFFADFHRHMSCTTNILSGREFDSDGQRQITGSGCASCPGCETKFGNMGVVDSGYQVERNYGTFSLAWSCPSCGTTVHEKTTPITCISDAKSIAIDPICNRCRKQTGDKP